MVPLYDRNVNLVGWIEPGQHIWDTSMDWVAYLSGGHVWSVANGNWCGPVNETNCLDQSGKVVAWSPANAPVGTMRPMRPMRAMRAMRPMRPVRPIRPVRPVRPMTPMGGWSPLSFRQWLAS